MNKINLKQSEFSPLLFCYPYMLRHLKILALAMMVMSLLYLMAANWWMLPQFIRLSIPMLVLLGSAIGSMYFADRNIIRQSLDTVSGFMLGLNLAVIGQIYQTGADSYLLFLVWAILLLPWLYRPNIGVLSILLVVSQLALYFYFKQSFWMEQAQDLYVLALNVLTALSFMYAIYRYPTLRFLLIAFITIISIGSMMHFIESNDLVYLASVFILPVAAAVYFYCRQAVLECILLIAGVALSLSLWLLQQFDEHLFNSAGGLFVFAVLIFSWFAAFSFGLTRLFPKSSFSMIPLAIGAWIAGIILAVLLLTFWQSFSMVMGIVFIGIAWLLLHHYVSFFVRQLAYCLWVCGQTAVLVHIGLITDNLWLVWLMQLVMLFLTAITRKYWFILSLQLIVGHILGIATLFLTDHFYDAEGLINLVFGFNTLIFIAIFLTAGYWQSSAYMKSIVLWLICILIGVAGAQSMLDTHHPFYAEMNLSQIVSYLVLPSILILVLQQLQHFKDPWLWSIPCLGFILVFIGYFEIYIVLIFIAWARVYRHQWVYGLCILLLIFWLWMLYYNLGISFLYKSFTIFISGLMIYLMSNRLKQIKPRGMHGEIS